VIGLTGAASATANICLGLLIAIRYNPQRTWPYTRINIFAAHNYTAYAVLATIVAHPLVLLFATKPRWSLWQIGFPVWSPAQQIVNTIGAFGMYSIMVVVITSYLRKRIGRQRWKSFHFLVYPAAACIFAHGILAHPKLSNDPIDPLDTEKLLVELCLLIITVSSLWAWRIRSRSDRPSCSSRESGH
jgi:DMSO/TMAO reductase YedYZ heme-binding membrane subunit